MAVKRARRLLRFVDGTDPGKAGGDAAEYTSSTEAVPLGSAPHLISSQFTDREHCVVIDVDMPCHLIESSPGKHHLYIDKPMDWPTYRALLVALERAGIIEPGYLEACLARRFSCLRIHDGSPLEATLSDDYEPF